MNYKKLFKKYKYLILTILVILTISIISYLRYNCMEPFVCSVDSKQLYDEFMFYKQTTLEHIIF